MHAHLTALNTRVLTLSAHSKRSSSKHRLLPEDDEDGISSSSSRSTSVVTTTARAGSTHELLEHDTYQQQLSRSSQHQGTPVPAAKARPHGGNTGSGPGVALSTFAGTSGGSYAAAVAGSSGAGDPGVGNSGGGGRRGYSSGTGGVAGGGGGSHGGPGHSLPAVSGGGPFGVLSTEQSGASFGSILSSDSRREPFIPVDHADEEDQGAGRREPGGEFSATGAMSSAGGGGPTGQGWHSVPLSDVDGSSYAKLGSRQ